MISVRLSEEEYAALRGLCAITGARSVSDITRDAMRVFLSGSGRETVLGGHLQEWQAHLCSLDARIEQLALEIRTLKSNLSN
jgi:hypothetical protein